MSGQGVAPDQAPLTVAVARGDEGHVMVRLAGELDLATSFLLTTAVEGACSPGMAVELDLENVRFIDSSGVGAIVLAHRVVVGSGGRLTIGRRSGIVDRVLEVSGVERALAGP
ncbi:MAG: STAS domain-containing protein [Acidimicrobiia bacterium]